MSIHEHDEIEDLKVETWPKLCGCGERITEDAWERLHYVGVQKSGLDNFPDLELRNCGRCRSTIAIAVPNDFV